MRPGATRCAELGLGRRRCAAAAGTSGLPGTQDELDLSALHLLLEDAEARLLLNVQNLVDRVARAAYVRHAALIDLEHS